MKTTLNWIPRLIIAVSAVASTAATPADQATEGINPQLLYSLISVEQIVGSNAATGRLQGSPIGSAFLVGTSNAHVLLVTAKHVIAEPSGQLRPALAYRFNNKDNTSDLVPDLLLSTLVGGWFLATNDDVACRFVSFADPQIAIFPLNWFLNQDTIRPGAPVLVIGFPLGLRSEQYAVPIVRRGIVAQASREGTLIDAFTFPGNSGGPVIYSTALGKTVPFLPPGIRPGDALVGLVSSSIQADDVAISPSTGRPRIMFENNTGLTQIVPAETILQLLQRSDVIEQDNKLTH